VDKFVDTGGFEVVHAGGCTGYDKLSAAVEIFEGLGGEGCVFVVA